jgi:hypothetical protein
MGQAAVVARIPDLVTIWSDSAGIGRRLWVFYAAVVVIQTIHVAEHVIQLFQVYAFGVAEDDALGLLGYVFEFQGTEEWLHLTFNASYLVGLAGIFVGLLRSPVARHVVPLWAMLAFMLFGVFLEAWHVVEHLVIISAVMANDGCPCPGILDSRLGVTDTILHFFYNAIAYSATVLPFAYLLRRRSESLGHDPRMVTASSK